MVSQSDLLAFVEAKLAYEIDVVAAAEAQAAGAAVIVDTRRQSSWDQGHIAGALHLPNDALDDRLADLPSDRALIVYGWGPGCNGATHTARRLLAEGFEVRELIGGYEYWVRNGFPVERGGRVEKGDPDVLVTHG
ncbi:rhodanese-like domain-containing protein [Sinomonas atrocyanea]|uniref:rhodanese-like domain-containing protein n=1 Tax=Sinomonas atrocyanea TaxID=37927 RepID=UPI002789DF41|nr:rhodanese-like domain-containing protein [Sinomonas atrocyanea]MDQ0260287.1 rhodanese-related sulfurtransferase [Sinomonas atrocyanea]MDR6620348.1 rhodanese-related sulfurtransferase [Sinomonas atrocyanea]